MDNDNLQFNYSIDDIRQMATENNVIWQREIMQNMQKMNLKTRDILNVIFKGNIIETFKYNNGNPGVIMFGFTLDQKALSVIMRLGYGKIWIISTNYALDDNLKDLGFKGDRLWNVFHVPKN